MIQKRSSVQQGSPADATFTVSVAANLAGMHAQTLRQYDRLGLVTPSRTKGGGRRYVTEDIDRLRHIQDLTQAQGINLAGVQRVLELEDELRELQERIRKLAAQIQGARTASSRVFTADSRGKIQFQSIQSGETLADRSPEGPTREVPASTVELVRPSRRALARPGLTGWQLLAALRLRQLLQAR